MPDITYHLDMHLKTTGKTRVKHGKIVIEAIKSNLEKDKQKKLKLKL